MIKIEKNYTLEGLIVFKTEKKLLGHDIYQLEADKYDYGITLYVVNSKMEVISTIRVEADCAKNIGFVSDWNVL